MYYAATYTLRGKARTDARGRLEVLTVRPGEYGGRNVGHIHAILSGNSGGRFRTLTTQCYVCPGNEAKYMERDMYVLSLLFCALFAGTLTRAATGRLCRLTWWRPCPADCVVRSWTVGEANKGYLQLPELPVDDVDSAKSVAWWNARMEERGVDTQIVAVGRHALKLT